MKAIALASYGGPEVLEVIDLPDPHAGPCEVRIRVQAAGVNPADVQLRQGLLDNPEAGITPPLVPGLEVAGTIDETGDGVTSLSVGDAVVGFVANHALHGGYSEVLVLSEASVATIPRGLSMVESASFLMNALTARIALDTLNLPPASTLAVTGSPGAFGGFVIQLAANEGHRVIGDAAERDEDLVRSLGAADVVRRGPDIARRIRDLIPHGVDGVADGAALHDAILPALRDGGTLVSVRGWSGQFDRGITANTVLVTRHATDAKAIRGLRDQVEAGVITPRVAATCPAAQAADAHRELDAGGVRGRIVLTF